MNDNQKAIEEYLARGGKITKCDYVPPKPKKIKNKRVGAWGVKNAAKNQTQTIWLSQDKNLF